MPGGNKESYAEVQDVLEAIAANTVTKEPRLVMNWRGKDIV